MNVVIRGTMASALGVYAAIHLAQAGMEPASSPGWLTAAFVLTAIVAVVLAGGLILAAESRQRVIEGAGIALAASSMGALLLSYTTGFLGVTQDQISIQTAMVLVAEVLVIVVGAISMRLGGGAFAEVERFERPSSAVPVAENRDREPAMR